MPEPASEIDVRVRDVTLRDGLQDEPVVATADKVALFEALVAAGIDDLEVTSFVRPDRVPAMADAAELAAATTGLDGVTRWALALNTKGAQRAAAAGLDHLQFVLSVSDTHGRHNAGRSAEEAVAELTTIVAEVGPDVSVEATLATAFGCPYEGAVDPGRVLDVLERVLACGVVGVSLADTIGTAVPSEVRRLVGAAVTAAGDRPVGAHLHDTRGLGIPNALAALEAGARRIDGSVGGLGGCPSRRARPATCPWRTSCIYSMPKASVPVLTSTTSSSRPSWPARWSAATSPATSARPVPASEPSA